MKSFYFRTFAKIAVLPYIGGTIAHVLRLIYKIPIEDVPMWLHWIIVLLGGYASFGFILFFRKIIFKKSVERLLYLLVIFHLGISVILHGYSLIVQSNNWMKVFSLEYSYFAIFYFVGLGLYCSYLSRQIDLYRTSHYK